MQIGRNILIGFFVIVIIVVLSVTLYLLGVFGGGFLQRTTADFRGETAQIEAVKADPNYRIASYEKFYDLYAAILADDDKIKNLKEELETTNPSSSRIEQINSSITAVKNSRAEKIRQYNADAQKEDTRANFLASNLPYEISLSDRD